MSDFFLNPNSLDNKGSCWILKNFYCSVTMLRVNELLVFLVLGMFSSPSESREIRNAI